MSELNFDLYSGSKAVIESLNDPDKQGNLILDPENSNMYVVNEQGTADVVNESYFADAVTEMTYSEGLTFETIAGEHGLEAAVLTGCENTRDNPIIVPKTYQGLPVTTVALSGSKITSHYIYSIILPETVTRINSGNPLADILPELRSITSYNPTIEISSDVLVESKVCEIILPSATPEQINAMKAQISAWTANDDVYILVHSGKTTVDFKNGMCIQRLNSSLDFGNAPDEDRLLGVYLPKSTYTDDTIDTITSNAFNNDVYAMKGTVRSLNFKNCTKIDSECLAYTGVNSITLSEEALDIGDRAFYECDSLTKLDTISTSKIRLKHIGDNAFVHTADDIFYESTLIFDEPNSTFSDSAFFVEEGNPHTYNRVVKDVVLAASPITAKATFEPVSITGNLYVTDENYWDFDNWKGRCSPLYTTEYLYKGAPKNSEGVVAVNMNTSYTSTINFNNPSHVIPHVYANDTRQSNQHRINCKRINYLFIDSNNCKLALQGDVVAGGKISNIITKYKEPQLFADNLSFEEFEGNVAFVDCGELSYLSNFNYANIKSWLFDGSFTLNTIDVSFTGSMFIDPNHGDVELGPLAGSGVNCLIYFGGTNEQLRNCATTRFWESMDNSSCEIFTFDGTGEPLEGSSGAAANVHVGQIDHNDWNNMTSWYYDVKRYI